MSKKSFFVNSFILICAGFLTRIIGFFYRIFLSHTIGAEGIGIFQLTLPIQTLIISITAGGMQTAISYTAASCSALKKSGKAKDYFLTGSALSILFALVLSFFFYQNADFFAVEILKEARTLPLLQILAFSFPLNTLHLCINSYYFSQKNTIYPSIIQMLEQIARIISTYFLYLIYVQERRSITPFIAACGSLISEIIAALAGIFFITFIFREEHYSWKHYRTPLKKIAELLQIACPVTLNRLLVTLLGSIEVICIPKQLQLYGCTPSEALSLYGIFTGMAIPLIFFPSTITNSISTLLIPSVTELLTLKKRKQIQYLIFRTCKYCLAFGCGCFLLFYLFGNFLGNFLFKSNTAGTYIKTLSYLCPFLYLNFTLSGILNGLKKNAACLLHNSISICIRITSVFFFMPVMGMSAYLYGILFSELVKTVFHLYSLWKFPYEVS